MWRIVWFGSVTTALACAGGDRRPNDRQALVSDSVAEVSMNRVAESYVQLVLAVGQHDPNYVDAYYGPEQWKGRRFGGDEEIMVDLQDLRDYQPFLDWLAPKDVR